MIGGSSLVPLHLSEPGEEVNAVKRLVHVASKPTLLQRHYCKGINAQFLESNKLMSRNVILFVLS